ncbi:2-dehydropantoate 2-reductase protein [Rutstroemia sp. NJR-2017a BBW]|nr:2-dehydropantoate 2-reductase protein [Rutstroemia sp. NJR-2017a BBW]
MFYGLGAIGSIYAFILSRCPNVRLTVVARSNYEAVKKNGMKIISQNHGEHVFHPAHVIRSPTEAPSEPYDYVVCSHKAINQATVASSLAPIISPSTTLVIIQNGVGNESPFHAQFPNTTILSCVAWTGGIQSPPGVVHHTNSENLQIGIFLNVNLSIVVENQRLVEFTDLLEKGGTPHEILSPEELQEKRWEKCIWNCAWNCLTTLTRVHTHEWLESSPEAVIMTRRLMEEVSEVARRDGVKVREDLVESLFKRIMGMPSIGTSMLTDARCGRRLELDVILGTPVRRGRELGVKMEVAEVVYTLLVALDKGLESAGEASG